MASKLSDAKRSLQRAKESAQSRLVELDQERREIKASVKSLDTALKALNRQQTKTKDSKNQVTPSEIVELVVEILMAEGEQSEPEIAKKLAARILELGKSRAGLELRLTEALKDQQFVRANGRYGCHPQAMLPDSDTNSDIEKEG